MALAFVALVLLLSGCSGSTGRSGNTLTCGADEHAVEVAAGEFVCQPSGSGNKPNIGFAQNQSTKTLFVTKAERVDWNDIEADVEGPSGCQARGDMAGAATVRSGTAARVSSQDGTSAEGGDAIVTSGGTSGQSCTLTLRYIPANQLYGTWTFNY